MEEFNLQNWLDEILLKTKSSFGKRLVFMGYQGSHQRGEATINSDVDMVVILDEIKFDDLKIYKNIVKSMSYSEKACGFISGKSEIQNWAKSDLFQFIYDTKPLYGNLSDFLSPLSKCDIRNAIQIGAQNLYHAACHSFIYNEDIKQNLAVFFKMTFFILQARYFLNQNEYIPTKTQLFEKLDGIDGEILNICINKELIADYDDLKIEKLYEKLICWCSCLII